jgi:phage-related protein
MITYNGVNILDVAPVKIEDIVVSPIRLNPVARQRAIAFGAEFVRMGGGTRTVTISFALLTKDTADREQQLQDIRDWASNGTESALVLPDHAGKHLECICTQLPEASFRKWWENKLRLEFTCYSNPYWTADTEQEAECGETPFQVNGSAPPLMRIERTLSEPATAQEYHSGEQIMTFSTIPAGQLTIDLTRQTADVDGVSIMQHYDPNSEWIVPTYGGQFQTIGGVGQIRFCERWL